MLSTSLIMRRLRKRVYSPASLFAAGEQGAWYDPSDMTTLYQDAAGTTPVTAVEQPVGLILDKSKGLALGSELVTNGDFSNGTTGWSTWNTNAQMSVSNGQMTITQPVGGNQVGVGNSVAYSTVVGRTYQVSLDVISYVGAQPPQLRIGDFNGSVNTTSTLLTAGTGRRIAFFVANTTSTFVNVATSSSAGNTITFDNISVKLLSGNHASQATSGSRPVLSARVNQLTYTDDFSNGTWKKVNCTVSAMNVADPIGGNTAATVTATGNAYFYYGTLENLTSQSLNAIWVRRRTGSGAIKFRTSAATVTDTDYSSSITASWSLLTWNCTAGTASENHFVINIVNSGDAIDLWHPDMRSSTAGTGLPAYQRVGAATAGSSTTAGNADYNTSGFPPYLRFDGSNDNLATASIDFSSTSKMTLFAGVRKLSDAALGVILEAAPNYTVAGGIGIFAPDGAASARYSFAMTGATGAQFDSTPASYAAPVTSVLQSSMDISQLGYAGLTARVNGAAVALSYTGAGVTSTGNFGNYVVHIGRRGGSTSPFNGRLYSLIVRGAQSTNAQITNTETWVNRKTGAY